MANWYLDSVEITGGFLPGLNVKFPKGLTCIIGARGSGKSTLMEALRYGLAGTAQISKGRFDLIQANLGSSVITLRTAPSAEGSAYIVRRTFKQPASLATAQGTPITDVNLDRGTFLPLDAYTSAEIEGIADETLGEKRRALLDALQPEALQSIVLELSELRRSLESSADAVKAAKRLIADLNEQIEELGDAHGRLSALPKIEHEEKTAALRSTSKQHYRNETEAKIMSDLEATLQSFVAELENARDQFIPAFESQFGEESKNASILQEASMLLLKTRRDVEGHISSATSRLTDAISALKKIRVKLQERHSIQRVEFDDLQRQDAAMSQAIKERSQAEQGVAKVEALERQRTEAKETLLKLLEKRKSLKGKFLLTRERLSTLRENIASELQGQAGHKVRIRVLRNADNLGYQQLLTEGLRGARVRNHEDILDSLLRLRPEQLAQMVQDNDLDEFENQLSLGRERSQKVLEAFRQNLDPLRLETMEIEDRICIELNVGSDADPAFKDASELSRGQKCTALLPILLAQRNTPLLIDQPEDNLDNHFIYETVVESIRRLKAKRQMIFITHNANIPVLGEAELVVVLDSDGRKGFVRKAGTLDVCRDEIVDLLEGGKEAFELRRKRYARW